MAHLRATDVTSTDKMPGPFLIDAFDIGQNEKGVSRVLVSVVRELHARAGRRVLVATTTAGSHRLAGLESDIIMVTNTPKSVWEQFGLPRLGVRVGAVAMYAHREAGPLWGPPLVLHIPEDPEVRWARQPARSARDRLRRAYSRRVMHRSLRRAALVAASVPSVAQELRRAYGIADPRLVPLGVDHKLFSPAPSPREDHFFHLGSADPRDRTDLVMMAYSVALRKRSELPKLVVGGALGDALAARLQNWACRSGCAANVHFTGRISDAELADLYRHARVVMQPAADEGFGLQPLEALASGAPLVVARTPAVSHVVDGAAVVTDGSCEELVEAVLRLDARQSERDRLRQLATEVSSGYSWQRTAEAVLVLLDQAADRQEA